jgi:hypothetical protein
MVQLAGLFQKRANLFSQLGKMNAVPANLILRMLQRESPTAAARAAGLHKFIGIDHVVPGLIRPLVESFGGLRNRAPTIRYKPKDAAIGDNNVNTR